MLDVALEAARQAGLLLMESRRDGFEVHSKGLRDFVTDADGAAQEVIYGAIRSRFPDHDFVGEEEGGVYRPASGYQWIVDPLDGTTNYARGLPLFAVSVGLAHRGTSLLGVVHAPTLDLTFAAERGKGATLKGEADPREPERHSD